MFVFFFESESYMSIHVLYSLMLNPKLTENFFRVLNFTWRPGQPSSILLRRCVLPPGMKKSGDFVDFGLMNSSGRYLSDPNISTYYIYNIYIYTKWGPPVISWFINPSKYSYKYHKP
jgi:hypothetical protein